jgi:drug/metabolite transporter (DMT)-like permease
LDARIPAIGEADLHQTGCHQQLDFRSHAMDALSSVRLVSLAAIWGASFLFLRIAVPQLGVATVVGTRVVLAALLLWAVSLWQGKSLRVASNWKQYLIIGVFNSALPFLLFGYAAKTLSASMLSILNATAPVWATLVTALWTRTRLTRDSMLGVLLGLAGVAILVGFDFDALPDGATLSVLAGIAAALSYGVATTYARSVKSVDAFSYAHGSMWAASLLVAPTLFVSPPLQPLTGEVVAALAMLGILCTGLAYLLYFRLIADVGAGRALTVTFLIPVFGVLWGRLFLHELIAWQTLLGSAVVIVGTVLATRFPSSKRLEAGRCHEPGSAKPRRRA